MLRATLPFLLVVSLLPPTVVAHEGVHDPLAVAAEYLAAIEASDLDRAESLFATDSLVFESGGVEGSWATYRAQHLGAEIDAVERFEIRRGEAPRLDTAEDGSLAVVAWPVEYTIELAGGEVIDSRGTVTFVLADTEVGYRITHLHWSSQRAATHEEAPGDGLSVEEAIGIATGQFDFEPRSLEAAQVEESGRPAWKVSLRGRPPEPGKSMGEFGEVVIDRETGEILTVAMS